MGLFSFSRSSKRVEFPHFKSKPLRYPGSISCSWSSRMVPNSGNDCHSGSSCYRWVLWNVPSFWSNKSGLANYFFLESVEIIHPSALYSVPVGVSSYKWAICLVYWSIRLVPVFLSVCPWSLCLPVRLYLFDCPFVWLSFCQTDRPSAHLFVLLFVCRSDQLVLYFFIYMVCMLVWSV